MALREDLLPTPATWKIALRNCTTAWKLGRTSCTSFWANQFRVLMTAAGLRTDAGTALTFGSHGSCARAQVSILRQRFLKLGVQVVATVRRVVLHLPQAFPIAIALSSRSEPGCANRVSSRRTDIANDSFVHLLLAGALFAPECGLEPC